MSSQNDYHSILLWDPDFSPFCNEIPLLNVKDLTQKMWDPKRKKKIWISQVYPKNWTSAILSMKKKWTPIPKFLANFDSFGGNPWIFCKIKQIFTIFNSFWSIKWTFFFYFQPFFRHFSTFLKFYPKWPKSTKNPYSTLWIFCFWVSKSSF